MKLNNCGVVFDKECHTYKLNDKKLSGVTDRIGKYLGTSFKGKEKIPNVVKARVYGTNTHNAIEDDFNGVLPHLDYINEVRDFKDLCDELGLKMIASEYLISDLEIYASCVDVTLVDKDNGVYLGDIKTPKKDNREYNTIQLSIYKYLFELINPHLKVKGGIIFRINRRGELIKESYKVEFLDIDKVKEILYTPFNKEDMLPYKVEELMNNLASVQAEIKRNEEIAKEFKARLLEEFNSYGLDKLDNDLISITRKEAYTRESFDKEAFAEAHPDIDLGNYQKLSLVKESILIKLK